MVAIASYGFHQNHAQVSHILGKSVGLSSVKIEVKNFSLIRSKFPSAKKNKLKLENVITPTFIE